jgi:glutaconate CoA-transferase subunit B
MERYKTSELMVTRAARELKDGQTVFVGIGLPNMACNLARRTHAPELVLIYESGTVGSVPERLPVSIGDPSLAKNALSICPMADVFNLYLQGGRIDVGFLGCAQIDRWGNINSTVISDYALPKVRLPGSERSSSLRSKDVSSRRRSISSRAPDTGAATGPEHRGRCPEVDRSSSSRICASSVSTERRKR